MRKILLHLGLPKTATTSLQHNVLRKLHDKGVVNFLGKDLDYCDKTGKITVHNYAGKFIRDAVEEKITIEEARTLLKTHTVEDKLNVFSDEGIMVAYPGLDNLPLKKKLYNLQILFQGYEVQLALTLREPVDYFYSLYVQLYPDYYSQIKELNSFEKYSKKLAEDKSNILFESFYYNDYLGCLNNEFSTEITYFEDLKLNKRRYYKSWSGLLGVSEEEFQNLFEEKHINQKQKTDNGSKRFFSLKFIESFFRNHLKKFPALFDLLKWFYSITGLKLLLNRRFLLNSVHNKPDRRLLSQLETLLHSKEYRKL